MRTWLTGACIAVLLLGGCRRGEETSSGSDDIGPSPDDDELRALTEEIAGLYEVTSETTSASDCSDGAGEPVDETFFVQVERGIDQKRLRVALCTGTSAAPECGRPGSSLVWESDLIWSAREPYSAFDEGAGTCELRLHDAGLERLSDDSIRLWWRDLVGTVDALESECSQALAEEAAESCEQSHFITAERIESAG